MALEPVQNGLVRMHWHMRPASAREWDCGLRVRLRVELRAVGRNPRSKVSRGTSLYGRLAQRIEHTLDFFAQRGGAIGLAAIALGNLLNGLIQPVASTADGEAFVVQQLTDATDEQHLMMLIVAPV